MKTGKTGEAETRRRSKGDGCHVREQRQAFRDAERKVRRVRRSDGNNHFDQNLCWCGKRWEPHCGPRGGYGFRRGYDRSSAIHGRDNQLAWLRRRFNQFAQRQCIVPLAVWADTSLAIDILDGRHDLGSRRCLVGESFRLRTLTIRSQVCAHLDPAVRVGGLSDPWPGKCPSFRHKIARSTLRMPTGV